MNAAEIKLKIFRQIDSLDKSKLEDLYGMMVNFLNSQNSEEDWLALSDEQKEGIKDAVADLRAGKGISHESILSKYRKK